MIPEEKAKELVHKFLDDLYKQRGVEIYTEDAILCSLIAVDEILNEYWSHNTKRRDWWQEVKLEIKLVLVNGRVTLNGKTFNELNPFEVIIFNTLIIQEREQINELLNI